MPSIYEDNYDRLLSILPDLPQMQAGDDLRLSAYSEGIMDLTVDVLERQGQTLRIALAHRYEQNGDLVPDPDMELRVDLAGLTVEALTYQDIANYDVVYPRPGYVSVPLKKALNSFLRTWLRNLKRQGHVVVPATARASR